jgi:hypothetical protein
MSSAAAFVKFGLKSWARAALAENKKTEGDVSELREAIAKLRRAGVDSDVLEVIEKHVAAIGRRNQEARR